MKLKDPKARDILSAEYVLGTLIGGARRRFEVWLQNDAELQARVDFWSNRLNLLGELLSPVHPPQRVWFNIQRSLKLNEAEKSIAPVAETTVSWWQNVQFWRWSSLFTSLASIVLGVYLYLAIPAQEPIVQPSYVAVLQNQQTQSAWLVTTNFEKQRIRVRTLANQAIAADKAFELWVLPGAEQAPRSLGLIPASGDVNLPIQQVLAELVSSAPALAVSLEPSGGSPTGLPTGPVLYQGKLNIL